MKQIIILDKASGNLSNAVPLPEQREPINGDWVLVKEVKNEKPTETRKQYFELPSGVEHIAVTVTLDKTSAKLVGDSVTVNYTIEFSEHIESPIDIDVPISITDRNGWHVDNVGLHIPANTPISDFTGEFIIERRGDFTVTNEAINFHEKTGMNIIARPLKLINQPWVRVYQ